MRVPNGQGTLDSFSLTSLQSYEDVCVGPAHALFLPIKCGCAYIILQFLRLCCCLLKARLIFEKATKVEYKYVDDLASVWCEWAEMEVRHEYVVTITALSWHVIIALSICRSV